MFDETKVTKNYGDYGGDSWWVEGELHVTGSVIFEDESTAPVANQAAGSDTEVNALLLKLKEGGIMERDAWTGDISAVECPSTSAMPTPETISNTGHIKSVEVEDGVLTVTLDCTVESLEIADHGAWGKFKWLGFGIDSGLESIVDLIFTDDTGAKAVLGSGDVAEATALGLDAGQFVLYIKANDPKYLAGEKSFSLRAEGTKAEKITMKIVEDVELDTFTVVADKLVSSDPEDPYPNESNIDTVALDSVNDKLIRINLKSGVTFNDLDNTTIENGDGPHKWVGVDIATGVETAALTAVNGVIVVPADDAGSFRVYIPAEREQYRIVDHAAAPKLYFAASGYETAVYSIGVAEAE